MREKITHIIDNEINSNKIDSAHGISSENIKQHLIDPVQQKYIHEMGKDKGEVLLWTVLEEDPKDMTGYTIFYDEGTQMFGLGMHGQDDSLISLGNYGTFIEALNGM